MLNEQEYLLGQKIMEGLKAEHDRVVRERDAALAKLAEAENLLSLAERCFSPRTRPGIERVVAAGQLIDALRAAGYDVDPPR